MAILINIAYIGLYLELIYLMATVYIASKVIVRLEHDISRDCARPELPHWVITSETHPIRFLFRLAGSAFAICRAAVIGLQTRAMPFLGCRVVCSVLVLCRDALASDAIGEISRGKKKNERI